MEKDIGEKAIGVTGSVSGAASILGSWQVCHNICLGIVALLSVIGITVTGMPLEFLTRWAIPLWTTALALLGVSSLLYLKKKCISKNLLIMNTGFIVAGIPFQSLQKFSVFFWTFGGIVALAGIALLIKERKQKRRCAHEN